MKLSGHSYDNGVFGSLLDGICKDVELKKKAQSQTPEAPITGMDIFSSTTEETLRGIHDEELESIAAELSFAADRAKVAVNRNDLAEFAKKATKENLRGKALERAAQRFCNDLGRSVSEPQRQTILGNTIEAGLGHKVISATYNPDSVNTTSEGKFLGCSKNPNSIWDTDALQRFAQVKHGDEKIKESREAQEKFAEQQKRDHWESLQKQGSDSNILGKGIVNAGTSKENEVVNCNLKKNAMSIFSNERDFENIPEETDGEKIAKLAEIRAQKSANAKEEWNQVKPMGKLNNAGLFDKLFKTSGDETQMAMIGQMFGPALAEAYATASPQERQIFQMALDGNQQAVAQLKQKYEKGGQPIQQPTMPAAPAAPAPVAQI